MFQVTTNPVYTQALADALLGALHGASTIGLLVTPTVHLRVDNKIPTPLSKGSDFTEAAFAGYAADTVSFTLAVPVNVATAVRAIQADADFVAGAVTAPVSCTGYWVDNGASTPAMTYMAENFMAPVPIVNNGDFIALDLIFAIHEVFATQ